MEEIFLEQSPAIINIKDYLNVLHINEKPSEKIISKIGNYVALSRGQQTSRLVTHNHHTFAIFSNWSILENNNIKIINTIHDTSESLALRKMLVDEYLRNTRIYEGLKKIIDLFLTFSSKIEKSKLKEIISFVRDCDGDFEGPRVYEHEERKIYSFISAKKQLYIEEKKSFFEVINIEELISFDEQYLKTFDEENKSHKIYTLDECKEKIRTSYPDIKEETLKKLDEYIATYTDEDVKKIPFVLTYMAQHLETTLALCGEVIPLVILLGVRKSFDVSEIREIKFLVRNDFIPRDQKMLITLIEEKIGPIE